MTQNEPNLTISERIEKARKELFNFNYPMFDDNYRGVFETHFIRHFYTVEIGFETEFLFQFQLQTWLEIHMPYFNQLFLSEQIQFDPMKNTKVDMNHQKDINKTQDDATNLTQDTTSKTDATMNQVTDGTGQTLGESHTDIVTSDTGSGTSSDTTSGTSNESGTHASDTDTNTTGNDSSFERHTTADTPQTRLRLQPEDNGSGVIEYASDIKEDKKNESHSEDQSVNTHGTTTNEVTTTGQADGTTTTQNNGTSNMDGTTKENTTEHQETDQTSNIDSSENVVNQQTLDRDITEMEKYVQHREGKIGVQTFSKMLMEYRSTFLRIERDIFNEMRKELFMLIY